MPSGRAEHLIRAVNTALDRGHVVWFFDPVKDAVVLAPWSPPDHEPAQVHVPPQA